MAPVIFSKIDNDYSLIGYKRRRRVLLAMLAASIAFHAAALVLLPDLARHSELLPPRPLEVVVLAPAPVAVPEPAPQTPPSKRPPPLTPKDAPVQAPREIRKPESASAPVIALPESKLSPESFPVAASPDKPKDSVPAPPQKTGTPAAGRDTAAISPPSFNVAYLRNPAPRYPIIARRNGEQGTVMLKVLVTREGAPASVSVDKTSGSAHLDSAALETVRSWRFTPARQGTQPVEAWVLVPIVFRLEPVS